VVNVMHYDPWTYSSIMNRFLIGHLFTKPQDIALLQSLLTMSFLPLDFKTSIPSSLLQLRSTAISQRALIFLLPVRRPNPTSLMPVGTARLIPPKHDCSASFIGDILRSWAYLSRFQCRLLTIQSEVSSNF